MKPFQDTPDKKYVKTTDKEFITHCLTGRSVVFWGCGQTKDKKYYILAQFSPQHKGEKSTIFWTTAKIANNILESIKP